MENNTSPCGCPKEKEIKPCACQEEKPVISPCFFVKTGLFIIFLLLVYGAMNPKK
ncbi:MAG: hypothetical protein GY810_21830 [Aureispira sp.]|nr:hypothetical protein [Aureispira sp.]